MPVLRISAIVREIDRRTWVSTAVHDGSLRSNRLVALQVALPLALLSAILLSPKLWLSSRDYPLIPVFDFLPPLDAPFDALVFAILVAAIVLAALAVDPRRYIAVLLAALVLLILFDQTRLQPWTYQYLFMFGALAALSWSTAHAGTRATALNSVRFIIAITYVWSGAQKLNVTFADEVLPWFAEPITDFLPVLSNDFPTAVGFMAAALEIALGMGLLFRKTRSVAVIGLIAMHVLILISLGPLGHNWNSVIWPWNVAMAVFLVILFWREKGAGARDVLVGRRWRFHTLAVLLLGVMPLLSFFDRWDSYLSSSLYSGNIRTAAIFVDESVGARLPAAVQENARPQSDGRFLITVSDWALNELNVTPYPENRAFRAVAEHLCTYADDPSDVELIVLGKPALFNGDRSITGFECSDL